MNESRSSSLLAPSLNIWFSSYTTFLIPTLSSVFLDSLSPKNWLGEIEGYFSVYREEDCHPDPSRFRLWSLLHPKLSSLGTIHFGNHLSMPLFFPNLLSITMPRHLLYVPFPSYPTPRLPGKQFLTTYLLPILGTEPDHFQCPGATQQQEGQQASWLCLGKQVRGWMEGVSARRPMPPCPSQSLSLY